MFVFPGCSPEKVLNTTFILPTPKSKRRGAWRQETGGTAERRGLLLAPDKPHSSSWEPAGKQSLSLLAHLRSPGWPRGSWAGVGCNYAACLGKTSHQLNNYQAISAISAATISSSLGISGRWGVAGPSQG